MKSDSQLKEDVLAELGWDPAVNANEVGVTVKDGVVTLTGHLGTYAEKVAAQRAAQRVTGVKALAVELTVQLSSSHQRTDAQIAASAEHVIDWNALVPKGKIRPVVEAGWITLTGEVEWDYQRRAAEASLRNLLGVRGVTNLVTVKPKVNAANVEKCIQDALVRQARREANHIDVSVDGTRITLSGKVHSWAERKAAEGAAWSAPGVSNVVDRLEIGS
jgi:osmotically-inducible protein OsmY